MVFTSPSKVAGLLFCFLTLKQVRGDQSSVNVSTTMSTTTIANNGIEGLPKFALMTNCSGADMCIGVTYSNGTQDLIKVDQFSENFYYGIVASTKAQAVVIVDEKEKTMELKFESLHITGCSWFGVFLKGSRPVECLDRSPGNSNEDDENTQDFQDESRIGMRSSGVSPSNWMKKVSDSTRLSKMSIPGTHDSGTGDWKWNNLPVLSNSGTLLVEFVKAVLTQDFSIKKQLESGVRFLDIRLRQSKNWFEIYHGIVFLGIHFGGGVLNPVKDFLNKNPTETVIISYQEELKPKDSTEKFEETMQKYINIYLPGRAYTSNTVPTLGSVRNKVVFLNFLGHGGPNQGLSNPTNFDGNTIENTWTPKCRTCAISGICFGLCKDYINSLKQNMNQAINDKHSNKLYITYLSAIAKGHPFPYGMSNGFGIGVPGINSKVKDYIEDDVTGAVKNLGIVIFDFVRTDLAQVVYQTNYLVRKPYQSVSGECRAKFSWFKCKQRSNNCKSGYHAKRVHRGVYCKCKCCNNMNSSGDFCGPQK